MNETVVSGPLGLDYQYIYEHTLAGSVILSLFLFAVWAAFLIYLLGQTADVYFSPCLATISEGLGLSDDTAGVTILALGNGAPDVFASVAAVIGSSGGANSSDGVLVGIGALLGAALFILTVIVGSIATKYPAPARPAALARDLPFYAAALALVARAGCRGEAGAADGLLLLGLYPAYVALALALDRWERNSLKAKSPSLCLNDRGELEDSPFLDDEGLGDGAAAFWHAPASMLAELPPPPKHRRRPGGGGGVGGALFGGRGGEEGEGVELVRSREGSLATAEGPPPIIHDHFVPIIEEDLKADGIQSLAKLAAPLLQQGSPGASAASGGGGPAARAARRAWRRRRRLRRALLWLPGGAAAEGELRALRREPPRQRVFRVFMWPVTLAQNISIPSVEPEGWNRLLAAFQPFGMLLVVAWGTAGVGARWALGAAAAAGLPAGAALYLSTHRSRPPAWRWWGPAAAAAAFALCVLWIYLLAGEAVAVIAALGGVSGVPAHVLALTFLAWGNSMGDLAANHAVARAGRAGMALAGCYGGPLFNLLLGLGGPLAWRGLVRGPEPLRLDSTTVLTLFFLGIVLFLTPAFLLLARERWYYGPALGRVLLTIYTVYVASTLAMVALGSKEGEGGGS